MGQRKLRKGQPKGSRSASGRKRDRTVQRVEPCDGVLRKRSFYGAAANDTDYADAIGRAYSAGLLGNGEKAKDLLNAGRKVAWQYWAVFKPEYPTPDTLARFQPQSGGAPVDPDRERILEDALTDTLTMLNRYGRDVRRAFDKLVIDMNPDCGPAWLDRIITAQRAKQTAAEGDMNMLRLAVIGLEMVA